MGGRGGRGGGVRREREMRGVSKSELGKLCESRGGRPGLPVPNKPCGFCGRKAALKEEDYRGHGRERDRETDRETHTETHRETERQITGVME